MSAYIPEAKVFKYLAEFLCAPNFRFSAGARWVFDGSVREAADDPSGRAEVCNILLAEAVRSVSARYSAQPIAELPGSWGESLEAMQFDPLDCKRAWHAFKAIEVLSCLRCYEYQSCEADGHEGREAWAICEAIKSKAIACLPGMADAPWGAPDPPARYKNVVCLSDMLK